MFSLYFIFLFSPFSVDWKSPQGDSRLQIPSQDSVSEEHPANPWVSRARPEEYNSIHFQYLASSWPWEATCPSCTVNKCHKWGQTVAVVIDGEILCEQHPMISLFLSYRKMKSSWVESSVVWWSYFMMAGKSLQVGDRLTAQTGKAQSCSVSHSHCYLSRTGKTFEDKYTHGCCSNFKVTKDRKICLLGFNAVYNSFHAHTQTYTHIDTDKKTDTHTHIQR